MEKINILELNEINFDVVKEYISSEKNSNHLKK